MADREAEFVAKIAAGVSGLNAQAWDRIAGDSDPFVSHAFLSALERSGSVGPGTGWTPAPILVEDDSSHLLAAAPAYLKSHSQGEYVFDHGWADAWERAGGDYYPKLQVAVPFTPVPGPRLLGSRPQHLLVAIETVTMQNDMSSAHITFVDDAGALPRVGPAVVEYIFALAVALEIGRRRGDEVRRLVLDQQRRRSPAGAGADAARILERREECMAEERVAGCESVPRRRVQSRNTGRDLRQHLGFAVGHTR
jgi:hypothetical protein